MSNPSQIAVEAAESLGLDFTRCPLKEAIEVIQSAIDRATEEFTKRAESVEGDLASLEETHELLGETCVRLLERAEKAEAAVAEMVSQRDEWKACAEELVASVRHIGWTSSETGSVIVKAEEAIARFNKLKEQTK